MRFTWLLSLILALGASPTWAHPHVWIEAYLDVHLDGDGHVDRIDIEWHFDEFYSIFAIEGLDADEDGVYSAEELAPVVDENLAALKDFGYFTFTTVNDEAVGYSGVEAHPARMDGEQFVLAFSLTPERKLPATENVQVSSYDPSYYVSITPADLNPVKLSGTTTGCTYAITPATPDRSPLSLPESAFVTFGSAGGIGEEFADKINVTCAAE